MVYTITVSDGTNTLEATYSAMTYVYNILSRDRAQEMKDVVAAIRLYNLAADAYKEGVAAYEKIYKSRNGCDCS